MNTRRGLVVGATAGAALLAGALVLATNCPSPAPQTAELEFVSVTVDGAPPADATPWSTVRVTIRTMQPNGGAPTGGVQMIAESGTRPDHFQEGFGAPDGRDR